MMRRAPQQAFALVLVLVLVAVALLVTLALAAMSKIGHEAARANEHRVQARQNALIALGVALAQLQTHAGPDDRLTGHAGVAGIGHGDGRRQLTGVWGGSGAPVWLASGVTSSTVPAITGGRILLAGNNSVGSSADRTDQELVEVGLIEFPNGVSSQQVNRYAYWTADEGIKISAVMPDAEAQRSGLTGSVLRPDQTRIELAGSNFNPMHPSLNRIISVEQLGIIANGIRTTTLHSLTVAHRALPGSARDATIVTDGYVTGALNINTSNEKFWRALLEFPSRTNPVFQLTADRTLNAARQIRDRIRIRGAPFASVQELVDSGIIAASFTSVSPRVLTVTQAQFFAEIGSLLSARSDTFRIRAYGDAGSIDTTIAREAVAYCEAIVQRTPEMMPDGSGRRFVITYFRWLTPADI